jgi:hypothetical protein
MSRCWTEPIAIICLERTDGRELLPTADIICLERTDHRLESASFGENRWHAPSQFLNVSVDWERCSLKFLNSELKVIKQ